MGPDTLVEIVNRHSAALVLYARQWCESPEDVVQGAFLKLARLATPPDRPGPWLYKVVRNAAIDAGRAESRRKKYERRAAARTSEWFEQDVSSGLDAQKVTEELASLPDEIREILVSHIWGGLSFEEIGELTGMSASTAYRRYAQGLETLRERMKPPCGKTA